MNIIDSPSPNRSDRPAGVVPRLVVIHGTVGTDAGDLAHIRSPQAGVSYNYLVQRPGTIHRVVHWKDAAWHAGKAKWDGVTGVNAISIGIGLSNLGNGKERFTDAQYESAGWLCAVFERELGIGMESVVGHHHVSGAHLNVRSDPKTDPWPWFEWGRLFAAMLRHR